MPLKTFLKHFPSHYDCPESAEILLPFLSYQDCKLKTVLYFGSPYSAERILNHLPLSSAFGQEKNVSLNNFSADQVTRALENVLRGKA